MSKNLSIRPYLKFQKANAAGFVPIYIEVTVDGDSDVFSLSQKVARGNWDQSKQACPTKSLESKNINTKVTMVKGELTRLFQQFQPSETVKASQLINLYFNNDPARKTNGKSKRDPTLYSKIISLIEEQIALVTRMKEAERRQLAPRFFQTIEEDRDNLAIRVEKQLSDINAWMDDPESEKSLMDAMHIFLAKYLFKVLKKTHSHESLRKWVSSKNVFSEFLTHRYKCSDLPLKSLQLKHADHLKDYLMLNRGNENNTTMKYIKNFKQIISDAQLQGWISTNPATSFQCHYIDPERQSLTLEEIGILIRKNLNNPRLNEVRDVFLFCCLTGFAYQEAFNLRPKDVKIGIDKKHGSISCVLSLKIPNICH